MSLRRQFFTQVTLMIIGATGLSACQDQEEDRAKNENLEEPAIDRATLDAVVDAFVPKDQDPGAVEAGITDILFDLFGKSERLRQHGKALLLHVELVAQHKFHKPFYRLNLARREDILHKTFHSRHEDDQDARRAIGTLRGHVIEAFYVSEVGHATLGYNPPYPDGYPDYHTPPAI